MPPPATPHIAILGAGPIGLEAGLYARQLKLPFTIYEQGRIGEHVWRYTIPGHGVTRWTEVCKILAAASYKGAICVELEDENFNGKEETEKAGLLYALEFLKSA